MEFAEWLGVGALVAAFVVPGVIEWLKRPRLEILASPWSPAGPVAWTFAAVRVHNRPLSRPWSWLLSREAAAGCVVWVDFFKWGTSERALSPAIPGRWSSHPEPLRAVPNPRPGMATPYTGGTAILDPNATPFTLAFDSTLIQRQRDVPASRAGEEVAVAILRAGEAFAFTDSSYGHPSWGQPDLRLARGTYRVVVRVEGSSVERVQAFKLEYLSDDFGQFQLQPVE